MAKEVFTIKKSANTKQLPMFIIGLLSAGFFIWLGSILDGNAFTIIFGVLFLFLMLFLGYKWFLSNEYVSMDETSIEIKKVIIPWSAIVYYDVVDYEIGNMFKTQIKQIKIKYKDQYGSVKNTFIPGDINGYEYILEWIKKKVTIQDR